MARILDASSIIERLATHADVAVTRRAAATYVGGIAVPGATSTIVIPFAVIVPASGRDLQRLDVGRRSQETRTIYTADQLLVGAQAGANEADLVNLDGVAWEVQLASEWDAAAGYCAAVMQRPAVG